MLENRVIEISTRRYAMEPGNSSRYEFSISDWQQADPTGVVRGIGRDGNEYVTLTIHNQPSGSYEVSKHALRHPRKCLIGYLRSPGHGFEYMHEHTVAAVAMACSVLVDRPDDLSSAAEAMLRAEELL